MESDVIRGKFAALQGGLDERTRRLWAATEAMALGRGGVAVVSEATGISLPTIRRGLRELSEGPTKAGRIRRPGGGRKKSEVLDTALSADLETLVDPTTRGDPMSPLRWTCKSTRQLA